MPDVLLVPDSIAGRCSSDELEIRDLDVGDPAVLVLLHQAEEERDL
jgi:hypothetical protein